MINKSKMNSGLWCVVLVSFITTCSASNIYLLSGTCPEDNHICNCDVGILNCTCSAEDHLVVEKFNETEILGVQITGCEKLIIHHLAFKNSTFEFVFLGNIGTLVIDRLAFFTSDVEFFEITNIADFRPKRFSFHGMGNITSMVLHNLKANTLPRYFAFEVEDLQIKNSHIGIVQSHAFMMIRDLTVTDCRFDFIQSMGFFLRNIGQTFLFSNNSVTGTEDNAFMFGPWFNVTFVGSDFEELKPMFVVGKYLRNFGFSNNSIEVCESFAFQSVHAIDSFVFSGNKFSLAEIYSLPFLYYLPSDTAIEDNTFNCDCEIAWLWTNQTGEDHDLFMSSNFCSDKSGFVKLDNLSPVFDKEDVCLDLLTSPTTTPEPTTTLAAITITVVPTNQAVSTQETKRAFRDNAAGKDCPYSIIVLFILAWTVNCKAS